jgi:hypothetical protein
MARGMAVAASPKLWMRSASRAMLPEATNTIVWATAVRPSTSSDQPTATRPSRERLIVVSTSPWL